MSNTLAIGAVTSTIRYVLFESLGGGQPRPVGGADVSTLRPDQIVTRNAHDNALTAGLNVYLYEITPNHALNLTDLPTRRPDGSLSRRPLAAIDLHYLVTAYGDDARGEPQRLIARGVLALSVNQVLTRDLVGEAIDHYKPLAGLEYLGDSDLGEQVELVKLSPEVLSLEELSRLWGILGTSYLLSVAYTATVVVLEAQVSPRTSLPVLAPSLDVSPLDRPRLHSVETVPPRGLVTGGTELHMTGSGLHGPVTIVSIGGVELAPAGTATNDALDVLVGADVPAGAHVVQVLHREKPGPVDPPPPRTLARSNVLPILVRPTLTVVAPPPSATEFGMTVAPPLHSGQRAELELNRRTPPDALPRTVTIELPVPDPGNAPSPSITINRDLVPNGEWLVRILVDGVESVPQMAGGVYDGPLLSRP
jgi:hypothetical protein